MWHLTRDRVLMLTTAVMVVAAGTMTVLYLTKDGGAPPTQAARTADPTPTANAPSSVAPAKAGSMKAGYAVRSKWKNGFNAEVTVTNLGSQPIAGWTVQLKLPPDVDVLSTWGAKSENKAGELILRSQAYNTYLEAGGSIRMGFEAKGDAAQPTSCTINGSPC
ncbi:cellulose binding domain-containing protein [Dactylosporangium sp. AC04546]|uniref:cellulose binding domain-containing protein n=1 Tax=Dactylosporangium sp. AC04546 TaxID=2862460 RepID=UPI001EE08CA6|nr:cellulose binding domain-containing protein [Dactylosporangium sp. AC04546]WVK83079.1 cellulose binding domain-containing protein [Dactylosporangium sp. AC04546]